MISQTKPSISIEAPDSLSERLFFYAEQTPHQDAVVTPTLRLSYLQLSQLVKHQAEIFCQAGFSQNAIIGIQCADDVQHLILCLAAIHLGLTSCTIPTYENDDMQNALIDRCGITYITDEEIAVDPVSMSTPINTNRAQEQIETHYRAQLLFSTSGTTGDPKLVIHYDTDIVSQAHRHIDSQQERFACLATMEHNFAKRHRLYCVAMGATNIFLNANNEALVSQALSLNINVLHVSAFQAQELLSTPDINKLSHIRLKLGGSHVPLQLRQQLRDNITNKLQAGYGTTETGAIAFTQLNDTQAGESVGHPLPGIEVRVVGPERKPLGLGEQGEIAVRCKGMFQAYLGKPEATKARLNDGWFYTGDIGYLDNQQRIHLCGRSDDMFVFNSMNIYPQEIETEIRQYPDVIDTVVLPKQSSTHGSIPVALVVFARHVKQDLSSLKKFVQKRVGVRSPRQYIIVKEIPRNTSGKIARLEAMSLPEKSGQVREDLLDLLHERIRKRIKPSVISDYINGDKDITFNELGMDSLARMDFLVALETNYDTVITLQEFSQQRYLGNIASIILSSPRQQKPEEEPALLSASPTNHSQISGHQTPVPSGPQPYLLRLFKRSFSYCQTVAQLSKVFSTLEHRLTPKEIECLDEWHHKGQLLPAGAATKFHTATTDWFIEIKTLMSHSGKKETEGFFHHRLAPNMTLFSSNGLTTDKTLAICFTPNGARHLTIPNAVLMQHTDARRFDLLIISDLTMKNYQLGVLPFGQELTKMIEQLAKQQLINDYRHIRTLGFSAGAHPAIVAGQLLNADIALSINGRFHRKKHLFKNLDKVITTWRSVRKGRCSQVLLSYSKDNSRDRKYTKIIEKLTRGTTISIEIKNEKTRHLILQRLLERGELADFFSQTIFSKEDKKSAIAQEKNKIISFPTNSSSKKINT